MMTEFTLFTTLALHHLIIGSALTIVLFAVGKIIKTSAEMRSWIWMTVFLAATLIPFSLFNIKSAPVNQVNAATVVSQPLVTNSQSIIIDPEETTPDWHVPSGLVYTLQQLLTLFMFIWLGGSLWRGVSVLRSFAYTRQLIQSCHPLDLDHPLHKELSKSSRIDLLTSNAIASPLVSGITSPKIIFPENILNQLEHQQLGPILLHEQAHVQRFDVLFGILQELIAIIFWWSPVIRILNRKIHVERELACDLRAAKQLSNKKQYAQSLIDCAKLMITQHRSILAMGLFSQKKELSHRISEVLKSTGIKAPNFILIASVCFGLTVATVGAAHSYAPKISVEDVKSDSIHYSIMDDKVGLKLIDAVDKNDIQTITQMINDGTDIDTPAIGDGTALIIAVRRNNVEMVQALIDLGANVNQSSHGDGNPLINAVMRNNLKIAQLLIDQGADVNQSSHGDGNPLINAAMRNNLKIAQLLIDQGADVNSVVPRDETPLINATRFGHLKMSQLLVKHGADVNLKVQTGASDGNKIRSPLNMAKTKQIKDFLIEIGATN
jgi:bla regulator protein BlaR1